MIRQLETIELTGALKDFWFTMESSSERLCSLGICLFGVSLNFPIFSNFQWLVGDCQAQCDEDCPSSELIAAANTTKCSRWRCSGATDETSTF